jgi:ABC-type uncharacterized transport system fused permease/ATPase subunit
MGIKASSMWVPFSSCKSDGSVDAFNNSCMSWKISLLWHTWWNASVSDGSLGIGPNGSGKTSLFRVLGGLWPIVSGSIAKPGMLLTDGNNESTGLSHEIFYVPQRPYTALGSLRDQLIYPLTLADATRKVLQDNEQDSYINGMGSPLSVQTNTPQNGIELLDQRLRSILEDVRLVYLLEREGGWDVTANWEDMLSLGEQQRLGMARLFFHHPKFGILDECTK